MFQVPCQEKASELLNSVGPQSLAARMWMAFVIGLLLRRGGEWRATVRCSTNVSARGPGAAN
jgi:hypothetical protein